MLVRERPGLRLQLTGAFRLTGRDGSMVEIVSRKGMAIVAMLALSPDGERSREWLAQRLWGQRGTVQARASLRKEVSNLRAILNAGHVETLTCRRSRVRLDLDRVEVDVLDPAVRHRLPPGDLLYGFEFPGEAGFRDWLAGERDRLSQHPGTAVPGALRPDGGWLDLGGPQPGETSPSGAGVVAFADRPSVAVFPFYNLTRDETLDYVAEGFSEELIDRLCRLCWLPVIARASTFAVSRDGTDHLAVGLSLGAKYLITGNLKTARQHLFLGVKLVEVSSHRTIWSRRLAIDPADTNDDLFGMVAEIVGSLDLRIDSAEQLSAWNKDSSDLAVSDLIWRGRWHANRLTREDSAQAHALFAEAMRREPQSPEALIQATRGMQRTIWAERGSDDRIREMRSMAQRAISLDPDDGRGYMLAGVVELWLRRPAVARTLLSQAIGLNPSLAHAYANLGSAHLLGGTPELAFAPLEIALRLSPGDPETFYILGEFAAAHSLLGNWHAAIDYARQSLALRASYWNAHVLIINALTRLDDLDGAARAWRDLLIQRPRFGEHYIDWLPFSDAAPAEHLKVGLRAAARAAERAGWQSFAA